MQRHVHFRSPETFKPEPTWIRVKNSYMEEFLTRIKGKCKHKVKIELDGPEHLITYHRDDERVIKDAHNAVLRSQAA